MVTSTARSVACLLLSVALTATLSFGGGASRTWAEGRLHHYSVLVFARPVAGQDAPFNAWYDGTHVPQMLEIPGFMAAERYHTLTAATPTSTLPPYLAAYELDSTDLQATNKEVKQRMTAGTLVKGEAMDYPSIVSAIFEPITPLILAKDLAGTTRAAKISTHSKLQSFELVVLSNPTEGREQEFNEWYTTQHVPDVLHVPGFVSGQRFKLVENDSQTAIPRYLVKFEFQSYDLNATIAEINRRLASGQTRMSKAIAPDPMVYFMAPLGARVQAQANR